MAISATQIATSNTLENFRQQYNNLQTDVNGLESGTLTFSSVSATTLGTSALNILEDGTIVFEGATDDAYETTLTVTDPTADRTITLPNATGTVLLSGSSSLTVADDGTIGSASDTDAIAISSAGVVTFSATTESSSATNGAVVITGGLGVAKDVSIGDDLRLLSDSSVLSFGADSDVTVTHDADDGLVLKSTATGDDNPFLLTLQTGETDIAANDKLGVIDFQAPDEGTGTDAILVAAGIEAISEGDFSSSSNATKLSFKTASSEAAAEKMSLSSAGLLTVSGKIITDDTTDATSTTDGSLQTDGGLSVAKDAVLGNDVLLLSDSAVLKFGADSDTTLTHTDGTGLTLNSTNKLCFNDATQFIQGVSGTVLDIAATDEIELTATLIDVVGNLEASGTGTFGGVLKTDDTTDATSTTDGSLQTDGGLSVAKDAVVGDDLLLLSDSAVLKFGADSEITVTHVADTGLNIKHTATADDKPIILTLQTGETDMAANDVMGAIRFQAPDESTGTDAILVAAAIQAVSEGDFSSSANATRLEFHTAASEAAAAKMTLSSAGVLDVDGGITVDNITIDGTEIDLSSGDLTIDVEGDIHLDANGGDVTFKDDGTIIGRFSNSSSDFIIKSIVDDKDMIFRGEDGGSQVTALTLDMSAAGAATFNNNVTAFSDERLKSDIKTLKSSLEKVLQMRGVSYTRNDNVEGGEQIGVIAQEVEKLYPQVVLTADDEQGTKSVDYGRLTAVLIEAVKELSEIVNRDILSLKKDMDAICQHPLWQEHQKKGE